MLRIPGQPGKDMCDSRVLPSRRDILRVGGAGMLGLSLGSMLELKALANTSGHRGGPGWGKAKSVIFCYLQGGPSHLDLWDPKTDVPDNVRSAFGNISTKIPGVQFAETLPRLAQLNDKFTLIRSMSYTPRGLFSHTAAIYQMMTGYTADKVSTAGGSRCCHSSCFHGRCRKATSSTREPLQDSWARRMTPIRFIRTGTIWT